MSIGPVPISRSVDLLAQRDLSTAACDLQHLAPHPSFHFLTEQERIGRPPRRQPGPFHGSAGPGAPLGSVFALLPDPGLELHVRASQTLTWLLWL